MIQRLVVPLAFRSLILGIVIAGIAIVFIAPIRLLRGDQPMTATLRGISAGVSWTGNAVVSSTTFDPGTCQKSRTCDIFTLTLDISDRYREKNPNFSVVVRLGWDDPQNDFDLYLSKGGEVIGASSQGQTDSEEIYMLRPANGIYHVFTHSVAAASRSGYVARATVAPNTPAELHRTAHYKADPDGIDGPEMFQFASTHDEAPHSRVDIDSFGDIHFDADAPAGDSTVARNGTAFHVFTGVTQDDIYLSQCEGQCSHPVTRRIFSSRNGRPLDRPCPVIAADQAGGLHIAYSDGRDVFLISSADQGATWRDPVPVTNPRDVETRTAGYPSIFAGDAGRVGILWLNEAGDVYYASTPDAFAPVPAINYVRLAGADESTKTPFGTVDPYGNAAIVFGSTTLLRQTAGDRLLFKSLMTVAGTLQTESGNKRIGFTVRPDFGGNLTFADKVRNVSMKSAHLNSSKYIEGKMALSGWGSLDDGTPVTFTMLTGGPGAQDHDFSISISNGYFAAGELQDTSLLAGKMLKETRRIN